MYQGLPASCPLLLFPAFFFEALRISLVTPLPPFFPPGSILIIHPFLSFVAPPLPSFLCALTHLPKPRSGMAPKRSFFSVQTTLFPVTSLTFRVPLPRVQSPQVYESARAFLFFPPPSPPLLLTSLSFSFPPPYVFFCTFFSF